MGKTEKEKFIYNTLLNLEKLQQLHKEIKDIDISVSELHPVTLVEYNTFFIFDLNESGDKYEYKLESPAPMPMPKDVLASFTLDCYNEKSSAIISSSAFNSIEGYIFIFHEFVHCFQWENGEGKIRSTLEIERKNKEANNYMWELNHPFPYNDSVFISKTMELDSLFDNEDVSGILNYYRNMKDYLDKLDYEYMIWQQWKEGFARYIENIMRNRVGIKPNLSKLQPQFSRVSFYDMGSRYIDLLIKDKPALKTDIKGLYNKMFNP